MMYTDTVYCKQYVVLNVRPWNIISALKSLHQLHFLVM